MQPDEFLNVGKGIFQNAGLVNLLVIYGKRKQSGSLVQLSKSDLSSIMEVRHARANGIRFSKSLIRHALGQPSPVFAAWQPSWGEERGSGPHEEWAGAHVLSSTYVMSVCQPATSAS